MTVLCSSANNSDKVRDIIGSSPTVQPVSDIRRAADTMTTREGGDEGRTAEREGGNTGDGWFLNKWNRKRERQTERETSRNRKRCK